jgi:DNA invertase Pin-like site-specific DNA recombinase
MNQPKIDRWHLERIAFVYVRQSTPSQVRKNVEGGERQRRMQQRVQELGWPDHQVRLLGADTGHSGSSLHGREDYQTMLQAVMAQEAGIIGASELSRLVRDNQDWNQLVRICRHQGVLLADEHRIYDPNDPQDRVVLGIQGAFNEFELAMIFARMRDGKNRKARRGELYGSFPPGYICRHEPLYEKHPDLRVRRAVEKVFQEYEDSPSVRQLHRRLLRAGFQLPVVPLGKDWREVEWVSPSYRHLLGMLRNPAYAGIYVRGRSRTFTVLNDEGHAEKKRRRVPAADWEIMLEDHHEAYISKVVWERNLEKIAANANMGQITNPRSPQNGNGLMVGLLRCRRCGHKLYAMYRSDAVGYQCRRGTTQRDTAGRICFSFRAIRVEERLIELLLQATAPASVAAAKEAAERFAVRHQQERQLLLDRLNAKEEIAARAAQEYKETDVTYIAVRRQLAQEWDAALAAVETERTRLAAFDKQEPSLPTPPQQRQLERLSTHVRRIWNHPRATIVLKKQIVRTLIREIVADVEDDEIVLIIHWAGGHHTELREPRRLRIPRRQLEDIRKVIDTLRKVLADEQIAVALNRERLWRPRGRRKDKTWTGRHVAAFRRQHRIPGFSTKAKQDEGWLTQAEAANRLNISAMSMTRLVKAGIVSGEQPHPGLPTVVQREDLDRDGVKTAVARLKASGNRPLTDDPDQLSLFK